MEKTAIPARIETKSGGVAQTPVPMLDLKRQYKPIQRELLEALGQVLETQQFILGEHVAAFERAAAEHLGVKHGRHRNVNRVRSNSLVRNRDYIISNVEPGRGLHLPI